MTVREAILKLVKDNFKTDLPSRMAKVKSVDTDTRTCSVTTIDTELLIEGVNLQADIGNGIFCVPKVDSFVLIVELARFDYGVVMYSEIESIQFLNGAYGGLVKVSDLLDKINTLENKVNSLISFCRTHTHAGNGAPANPPYSETEITLTIQEDLENELVKHGVASS